MDEKNSRLLYSALGGLMLVLLQANIFQNTIGIFNILGIYLVSEIVFLISKILSIGGAIIFVICAIRLIGDNFKFKMK